MNVGRIRNLLSDAMLEHLIRPTNLIESVGLIRQFRSIRELLSGAMLAHLVRPTNLIKPWADAVISNRPFAGNTGSVDDNDEVQRNLNDTNYNRMWEYNNRGVGSKVVAEAKK